MAGQGGPRHGEHGVTRRTQRNREEHGGTGTNKAVQGETWGIGRNTVTEHGGTGRNTVGQRETQRNREEHGGTGRNTAEQGGTRRNREEHGGTGRTRRNRGKRRNRGNTA